MRAFESHDGRFNFMVAGKDVDTALSGSSREGFIKTFEKITGRTDIEFGELIWLSVYTSIARKSYRMCLRLSSFLVLECAWPINVAKEERLLLEVCPQPRSMYDTS